MKNCTCRAGTSAGILLFSATLAVGACGSGSSNYEPDPSLLPADRAQLMDYPAEPTGGYGMEPGKITKNLLFSDVLMDRATFCKSSNEWDIKKHTAMRPMNLLDIARAGSFCPGKKKKFLWLAITAGW